LKAVEKIANKVRRAARSFVRELFAAILAQGHVAISGMPPAVPAAVVRTICRLARGLTFAQIDGAAAIDPLSDRAFNGSQLVLVTRLDRAPTDAHTMLFKAMESLRVEWSGQSRAIEPPFLVIAAQPSINSEGVHPLSETQLDHFMFCLHWSANTEGQRVVVDLTNAPGRAVGEDPHHQTDSRTATRHSRMAVSDHVMRYAVRAVRATRSDGQTRAGDDQKTCACWSWPARRAAFDPSRESTRSPGWPTLRRPRRCSRHGAARAEPPPLREL
jgi:MoxR-like ATPase